MEGWGMNEVQVQELGLRTHTDETGEEIRYYAIAFSVVHKGLEYGMVLSLDPDTEPGDPHYVMSLENGKRAVLAKALQDSGDEPTEQATS